MYLLNYEPGKICTYHMYAAYCDNCYTAFAATEESTSYEVEDKGKWEEMPAWLMPLKPSCEWCERNLFPGKVWEYEQGAYRLAGFTKDEERIVCGRCLSHQECGVNYDDFCVGDVKLFLPEFTYPYCDTKCVCDFCGKEIYPSGIC